MSGVLRFITSAYCFFSICKVFIFLDVFETLERDYGRIDIVCNNAGVHSFDYDVDQSQRAFRINLVRP